MKRKTLFLILILLAILVLSLVCFYVVFTSSSRVLYFSVRQTPTLISIRAQLTNLFQKLIGATALLVSGIFCFVLYIQTYETQKFFYHSVMFFAGAGTITSIIDYKVMFYAATTERYIWNFCSDFFLLVLSCAVLLSLFSVPQKRPQRIISVSLITFHALLCVCRLVIQPAAFQRIMLIYACLLLGADIALMLCRLSPRLRFQPLINNVLLIPLPFLLGWIAIYKFNTLSDAYKAYLSLSAYFFLAYTELLFLGHFIAHRKMVLLGRTSIRKMHQDALVHEMLTRTFILYCQPPINNLYGYAKKMQNREVPGNSIYATGAQIYNEVRALSYALDNVLNHIHFENAAINPDLGTISMETVFYYVKQELESSASACPEITIRAQGRCIAQGDPQMLIRANCALISTMQEFDDAGGITVSLRPEQEAIRIEIILTSHRSGLSSLLLKRRLRSVGSVYRTSSEDSEMPLAVAKAILAAHDCKLRVYDKDADQMAVSYSLPIQGEERDARPEQASVPIDRSDIVAHPIHVAMLSTSNRQVTFVRKCLQDVFFCVSAFGSVDGLMQCIKDEQISVVIIGTLFIDMDLNEILYTIREKHSMGMLPIILLGQKGLLKSESNSYKYVNDFVSDPCRYDELNQRVISLSMLQSSTKDLQLTRLDFLQSQMDPHFVFNAINTIMPMCLTDSKKAYSLLGNFSEYLRGNLFPKEQNHPIYIYEEMDLVRAYLMLEEARVPDKIIFNVTDECAESCTIYPFLIEPLVENSVKHGMRYTEDFQAEPLHISVSVRPDGDFLRICVQDDGAGFDTALLQASADSKHHAYHSIAIGNIAHRLKLYYNSELKIESRIGSGTTVSFAIRKSQT